MYTSKRRRTQFASALRRLYIVKNERQIVQKERTTKT